MAKSRKTLRVKPPLNSAAFNAREITKQLLLVEDHLSDDDKYCKDCIRKHFMTIEALAEEACHMDPKSKWIKDCKLLGMKARYWVGKFNYNNKNKISQEVRVIRKQMILKTYKPKYS